MTDNDSTCWFDASFYEHDPPLKDPWQEHIEEVLLALEPFSLVHDIKRKIEEDLKRTQIDEEVLLNFTLDTTNVLLGLAENTPVDKLLQGTFVGAFQARLCLEYVTKTCQNRGLLSLINTLMSYIYNAERVIGWVLRERHSFIPDLVVERRTYEEAVLKNLQQLTKMYIKQSPYFSRLRQHETLVKNFEIIRELETALDRLRRLFLQLRHSSNGLQTSRDFELESSVMDDMNELWYESSV